MISVRGVDKSFGRVRAVRGVSFEVPAGQVVGLLGSNGAGKTTTIRMITGYLPPDTGSIRIQGLDMLEQSAEARRLLGYLPESAPAYSEMSVEGYLGFRGRLFGLRRGERRAAAERVLDRCWLRDVRSRRIAHLSKGYRQRVGLAAAMLHDPPVLILDEPTNALDPTQIRETRRLIRELADRRTVLVSSHILAEVEKTCDRVIIMAHGRVRMDARPEDLLESVRGSSPYVVEARVEGPSHDPPAWLRRVPGVAAVELAGSDGEFASWRVTGGSAAGDLRGAIGEAALAAGALVRELRREAPTLERVFLDLIESEEPAEAAA